MKLREIAIYTIYKHPLSIMNKQVWCVQEQYWSYLKGYDTGKYQKVIIRVDDDIKLINNNDELTEPAVDVITLDKYFDIKNFLSLNDPEKKKSSLELLHASMIYIAKIKNWNVEPLFNAYKNCMDSNIEYRFKVGNKNFTSPTKDFIGYVNCYWDIDKFTATGVISRKNGSILKEKTIMGIEPYFGELIYYGKCKWDDAYTFSLYSKQGEKWSIAILALV
jgi:hypothetical protein